MSETKPTWVTDPTVLQRHLATNPQRVGLDTEFIRERTYWPQLALVQLAIGDDILLIDPWNRGSPAPCARCCWTPRSPR